MIASIFEVTRAITFDEIVTGLILYSIIHGIYKLAGYLLKYLETDAGRIIDLHVKTGHKDRFKDCFKDSCAIPGTASDSLRQAIQSDQTLT